MDLSKKLESLSFERAKLIEELEALVEGADERGFNEEETQKQNEITERINEIDSEIPVVEKTLETLKKKARASIKKSEERKATEKFSLVRAIKAKIDGRPLEGVEREVHEEAVNEARMSGVSISGVGVPSSMVRALSIETSDPGAGNDIATDLGDLIPALRPDPVVLRLGATNLSGLQGNLDLPRHVGLASAAWEGENTEADSTDPTFNKVQLGPNRLAAYTRVGTQLLNQSVHVSEGLIRSELSNSIARAIDVAAINGSGASNQPTGILNDAGTTVVTLGANGGAPTRAKLIEMITEIETDNADVANMQFLTTPGVKGFLMELNVDSGSGRFVLDEMSRSILGYPVTVSNQVPSNLTKAAGSDLHAILFGNWSECIIAQWAGVDIIADIYGRAKYAQVDIVVNSWWDVALRHGESFAVIKDADIS